MSEVPRLPESECADTRVHLFELMDGDLAVDGSERLRNHLESCVKCRAVLTRNTVIDTDLTAWGHEMDRVNPPSAVTRELLRAELRWSVAQTRRPRRPIPWIPAAALVFASALALTVAVTHVGTPTRDRPPNSKQPGFVAIPYMAPLDPRENATIVRMDIRVATLIAFGFRITADPGAIVPADVLVGEDGRAHAVRVLSDIELNGTGE